MKNLSVFLMCVKIVLSSALVLEINKVCRSFNWGREETSITPPVLLSSAAQQQTHG